MEGVLTTQNAANDTLSLFPVQERADITTMLESPTILSAGENSSRLAVLAVMGDFTLLRNQPSTSQLLLPCLGVSSIQRMSK